MPKLRRGQFVQDLTADLQRRGYVPAGSAPGICEWRRASAWQHPSLKLKVEIRAGHELRLRFPDGRWKSETPKDVAEAIRLINAAELTAEFGG